MKKILLLPILLVILGIGFSQILQANQKSIAKVGYCPSMKPVINQLQKKHKIKPVLYQSSSLVLESLVDKYIDIALIGRKAKLEEINSDIQHQQANDQAMTLVKNRNDINTKAFFTLWNDVDYEVMELVVPTHSNGSKIEAYRTPFFYYTNEINSALVSKFISII